MRMPLDYYRILGLPVQSTDEQLNQAYQDRSWQLPRREYSEGAIAARKQLLDEAYQVLSDPQKRAAYDMALGANVGESQQLLENTNLVDSQPDKEDSLTETSESDESSHNTLSHYLEIACEQFIGALLILHELGEYEQVIETATDYLNQNPSGDLRSTTLATSPTVRADLLLTLAVAYLELSREQWQQGHYETAAASGLKALECLQPEELFPLVQAEIKLDLCKLRPYRILELLALNKDKDIARRQGLQLLSEMLQERRGIEGKGNDHSGLTIDDFLRFVQQLRLYLTVSEQQDLFEVEAKRPSPVAAYLAVYALIARGFAEQTPALIVQAQEILQSLAHRQNVHLEQAICALLLGQTEAASLALLKSQDEEPLIFIREHSQEDPDLLLGLCRYCEYWLQTEVFAQFRDLAQEKASLDNYFANQEVQAYLEHLPADYQNLDSEITKVEGVTMAKSNQAFQERQQGATRKSLETRSQYGRAQVLASATTSGTATLAVPTQGRTRTGSVGLRDYRDEEGYGNRETRVSASSEPPYSGNYATSDGIAVRSPRLSQRRKNRRKTTFKPKPLFLSLVALCSAGAVALVVHWTQEARSPLAELQGENLLIQLHQPPVEIPSLDAQMILPAGTLNQEGAQQIIQAWLSSKSQAFGTKHQIDQLNTILTDPLLATWRERAENLKASQDYWQYQHQVQIKSLKTDAQNSDRALVEAMVQETAKYYQKGQPDQKRSYDENLHVRYELVRQSNQWLIQAIQVLN